MDASTEIVEVTPEVARALARALGIAWVGATLYDDPLEQDAFSKAAERIADMADSLPPITITPRTLRIGDRDLGEEGLSIEKLAHSCFIHGIGVVRFTPEVTPRSLATFIEVIQLDPETVAHEEGLARFLKRRLVLGIEVFAHAVAMEQADQLSGWDERWGWSAQSLTAVLESTPADDLGPVLKEGFRGSSALASVKERQAAVNAHVEALMNLRPAVQASALDWLFEQDDAAVVSVFDHLATHELLRLSQHLTEPASARAVSLLVERGVEDPALHPADLAQVVAALDADLPVIPVAREWWSHMDTVMTGLFESDLGREDQGKLIDVWAGVFDGLLQEGSFPDAARWLELLDDGEDATFQARVDTRRHRMPSRDGLRALVEGSGRKGEAAAAVLFSCLQAAPVHVLTLLAALGEETTDKALDSLSALIGGWESELLAQLPGLERPLALALSLLARSDFDGGGDERLVAFVNHDSPEVRVAALHLVASSIPLERLAELATDPSVLVQGLAVKEMASRGEDAVAPLAAALLTLTLSDSTVSLVGDALLALPGGKKALERTALNVRLLLSGAGRARRKRLQGIAKGTA